MKQTRLVEMPTSQHFSSLNDIDIQTEQLESPEDHEICTFLDLKQQLFEMLTRNHKSQYNSRANMSSIEQIQILRPLIDNFDDLNQKPYEPKRVTSTAYIEDDPGEKVVGAYFMTHDQTYQPQHCFHIVIYSCVLTYFYRLYPGFLRMALRYRRR